MLIRVVKCSSVKCSEALQCSDVLLVFSFLSLCIWLLGPPLWSSGQSF